MLYFTIGVCIENKDEMQTGLSDLLEIIKSGAKYLDYDMQHITSADTSINRVIILKKKNEK